MNTKRFIKFFGLILFAFVLSGCQTMKEANKQAKEETMKQTKKQI